MNNDNDQNSAPGATWILVLFIMIIPIMGIMVLALFMGLGSSLMERFQSPTQKASAR